MEDPLHREILEEHARSPGHQSSLEQPTGKSVWTSPRTGNVCSVAIVSEGERITGVQAEVEGSALAIACSSLMGSAVEGITVEEALGLAKSVIEFLEDGKETSFSGDLVVYESIIRFPERHDCAMLPWRALVLALKS
ncbi:MAG: iron-sulfur cluster assembly scaffold protein [Opitutae bacterium]|nr:iron-sulfur cluster assembly scaffold protein [Opitutae bacterium]